MRTIAAAVAAVAITGCACTAPPPDEARHCETPVHYVVESPDPVYVGPVWLDADGAIVAQVQSETDTTPVYVECITDAALVAWFESLDD